MAIRLRRGNLADFDKNKLVSGELGLILDAGELHFCYSAGNTKKLQTSEDLQEMLDASGTAYSALQALIADLELNPSELTNILNNITTLQADKADKTVVDAHEVRLDDVDSQLADISNKVTYLDPLMFGVVVNSDSIQAAIDSVIHDTVGNPWELLSNGKYIIQLPNGITTLTTEVFVPSYVKIRGYGHSSTIVKLSGCNGFICGTPATPSYHFALEGMTIDGQTKTTDGVKITGSRWLLSDVCVTNCNNGINLYSAYLGDIYSSFITRCNTSHRLDGVSSGQGCNSINFFGGEAVECITGFYVKHANNVNLIGVTIEDTTTGIMFDDASSIANFSADKCAFELNTTDIQAKELKFTHITNCFFTGKVAESYHIRTNKLFKSVIEGNNMGAKTNYPEIATISTTPTDIDFTSSCVRNNFNQINDFDISQLLIDKLVSKGNNDTNFVEIVTGGTIQKLSGSYNQGITSHKNFPRILTADGSLNKYKFIDIDDSLNVTAKRVIDGVTLAINLSRYVTSIPASATSNGTKGDWITSADGGIMYICWDTNKWRKITTSPF